MNDEQLLLANAYLDGELTAAERDVAESDPVVMAAVQELRALQAAVRDVEPASGSAREAAITAALAALPPAAHAATRAPATPTPLERRRRPAPGRYLAVAAGVLGIGLFGVAVANLGTDGDDDAASDLDRAEPAAEEPARVLEDASGGADGEAEPELSAAADEPAEEPAEEPAAEEPAEEPAADTMTADEPAEEPASEPAAEPGTESTVRPTLAPGQVLTTPEELGSFGTGLVEQERAGTLGATPNHACPVDPPVLGRAEYLIGDEVVPVLVAVDEPSDVVLAIADETCEVLVEGPFYAP